jgi:hypothetical protein
MTASFQVVKEIVTLDYEGAHDIIYALESLAHRAICIRNRGGDCPGPYSVEFDSDRVTLYLTGFWAITLRRDGQVVVEGGDAALMISETTFVLNIGDRTVEGRKVTWNGTEEVFAPSELRKSVKEDVKTILGLMGWL